MSLLPNFQKEGVEQTSIFSGCLLGKRWMTFSRGGCNFSTKNNLKSGMLNENKKVYKQECFLLSQLRIQTGEFLVRSWLLLKDKLEWKMKNFNIFGVNQKIRVLRGIHDKPIYNGHCLKIRHWDSRFNGGLGRNKGGPKLVFLKEEGLISQSTLWWGQNKI